MHLLRGMKKIFLILPHISSQSSVIRLSQGPHSTEAWWFSANQLIISSFPLKQATTEVNSTFPKKHRLCLLLRATTEGWKPSTFGPAGESTPRGADQMSGSACLVSRTLSGLHVSCGSKQDLEGQ